MTTAEQTYLRDMQARLEKLVATSGKLRVWREVRPKHFLVDGYAVDPAHPSRMLEMLLVGFPDANNGARRFVLSVEAEFDTATVTLRNSHKPGYSQISYTLDKQDVNVPTLLGDLLDRMLQLQ